MMKTLIAVIAYNERDNIAFSLQDLIRHNVGYDIVVIDNGSSDGTAQICRRMGIPVISHCINSGGSFGTVMTYFLYAYRRGYDVLCQFDGDGQHMAAELPKIMKPIQDGKADYVIGSRFLTREGFQSYFMRRIGIRLFAYLDSLITHQRITDATSGFRAYGRRVIEFLANHYRHELYDTNQLLLLSHFSGARLAEVPVRMKERVHGKSEYNSLTMIAFPFKGIINIAGCVIQRRSLKHFLRVNHGLAD